jgi:CHAD domain-containing protein
MEATLHALLLDRKRKGQRACDAVLPIRERAGKVRDMDVLMGFASTLSKAKDADCLVQLLEHLGHRRFQSARKLHRIAVKQRNVATNALKRCSSVLRRNVNGKQGQTQRAVDAAAVALQLSSELSHWPKLRANNLHPFRLKAKQLRYVLQLSGDNSELIKTLGETKDKIGEWHDWAELQKIAKDVIQHPGHCTIREQIQSGAKRRFGEAISIANRLRTEYLEQPRAIAKRGTPNLGQPVLKTTAGLVA